jgi:serine/threonine-protein kinase
MPLHSGDVFAGYRILRLLGSGGMGEVYLVEHPRLPRRDALKILPGDVSADEEFRRRFEREADLASKLWHPNIVGVHDRGEFNGQLWISMDYVDGLDAARLVAKSYPPGMPVELVVKIVTAVASALDYAHDQGLLHRDVKPANIMLTHPGGGEQRVLLADFGIARSIDDISGLTATNMTVGTVAYAAPEQMMGEELDGRADQYGLAATAYHLLTGSQLFQHSNPAVVISRHLTSPPPALADRHPELNKLDPVLAVALAKHPDDRFRRCSEFAQALSEQTREAGSISPVAVTQRAPVVRKLEAVSAEGTRAPQGWIVAASALALITLISAILLLWHPWQERDSKAIAPSASIKSPPPPLTSSAPMAPPPVAAPTSTTPPTTRTNTVAAVVNGEPANGYQEVPNAASPTHTNEVFGCTTSQAAAADNIYHCLPSAASADLCWPATPGTLLCVEDPWAKALFRVTVTDELPYAAPQPRPLPFAVLLDDGSRCRLYPNGPRQVRDDGRWGVYYCSGGNAILKESMKADETPAIDRSSPLWTVQVGPPGPETVHFPPPETHAVTTAWFAGD